MFSPDEQILVDWIRAAFPLTAAGQVNPPSPVDARTWARLASLAAAHGLSPLLYSALIQCRREREVPASVMQALREDRFRLGAASLLAFQDLGYWLDCFEQKQIPVVVLKGAALASELYPTPGLRPFSDLDLLVPQDRVAEACRLLMAQGLTPPPELAEGFDLRFWAQQAFRRSGPRPLQIELHWHLFTNAYYRTHVPIDWFWRRTREFDLNGRSARALDPAAQLLHLCAHYAIHHREERLIWLLDLALLVAHESERINWNEVIDATRAFELTLAVLPTLDKMQEIWGVAAPGEVIQRLGARRPRRAERLAFAIANTGQSSLRTLWDGASTPGLNAKLYFWLRHLFPSRTYLSQRYGMRTSYLMPLYYLSRLGMSSYQAGRSAWMRWRRTSTKTPIL